MQLIRISNGNTGEVIELYNKKRPSVRATLVHLFGVGGKWQYDVDESTVFYKSFQAGQPGDAGYSTTYPARQYCRQFGIYLQPEAVVKAKGRTKWNTLL